MRQQLIPVLQRILQADFPSRWPRFMDFTTELLNTNNPGSVLAGLQCLLAICRAFRYKAVESQDRVHFDKIVEICFPRTLSICNELVNQESDEAGEMLHLALKAYKHASWVRRRLSCIIYYVAEYVLTCRLSWNYPPICARSRSTSPGAPFFSRPCPRRRLPTPWLAMTTTARSTTGGRPRNGLSSISTVSLLGMTPVVHFPAPHDASYSQGMLS